MIFKRFDGFEVTPTDTIIQTLADAKLKVEQLQAQETGSVAWYINVIHPTKKYYGVVISDAMRSQFPTLAQNIDVFNGEQLADDLYAINARIDGLMLQLSNDATNITLANNTANSAYTLANEAKNLAQAGSGSTSGGNADKTLGFVSGATLTEILATVPTTMDAGKQKCVVNGKVYFAYRPSPASSATEITLLVFDSVSNTFSNINTGITAFTISNHISLAADVANNKIYICAPFNQSAWDVDNNSDVSSKIYVFDIVAMTTSLVTSITTPMKDFKIAYKSDKLYTSPGQTVAYDEAEGMFITVSQTKLLTYTISTGVWTTKEMLKGPIEYTVKYTGGANAGNIEYYEVHPELYGSKIDVYNWWVGDSYSTKIFSYDKYETNATLTRGIAVFDSASFKSYVIKHVITNGIQYLLMNNTKDFVVKRIPLTGANFSKNTTIFCIGSKLYLFDKAITSKFYTLDLTPYL